MSRRSVLTLAAFALCLLVVIGGMSWVSSVALDLSAREADARRRAAEEESVRLALWRLDSKMAPLLARESVRPYFTFAPFYPAEAAYNRMFNALGEGEVVVPSPLLTEAPSFVRLHFQFTPDDALGSPRVPRGKDRRAALEAYLEEDELAESEARLVALSAKVGRGDLLSALRAPRPRSTPGPEQEPPRQAEGRGANERWLRERNVAQASAYASQTVNPKQWKKAGGALADKNAERGGAAEDPRVGRAAGGDDPPGLAEPADPTEDVREGPFLPAWVGGELLLGRRIRLEQREYLQGVWLDWPALEAWLLSDVRDLLPEATLAPAAAGADDPMLLASLPVHLIPGTVRVPAAPSAGRALTYALAAAWMGVLLAAGAVGLLLTGTVALSERRAAFVGAVTHELRTPLTTFRMYSEMLADGMVSEEKRARYLETLRREAVRLSHLVENVLAYARLERHNTAERAELCPLDALLARSSERLRDRARAAGLELVVAEPPPAQVVADPGAVEQILFNLVDNACKYAAAGAERRINLSFGTGKGVVEIRVQDHGPGISHADRRRLFSPFSKSAERAAVSAPGVGLGLALSRRLARSMRGDLRLGPSVVGAAFVLSLPAAPSG